MTDPQARALAEVVADCIEALERGDYAQVQTLLERHPEHAEAVRRRLEALDRRGLLAQGPKGRPAEPSDPERIGTYRILRRLGRGGMGIVDLAHDERLNRLVALKSLAPLLGVSPKARERFEREVRAVAQLSHPGIVAVYEVGEHEGLPFFAMQFIDGATFGEILARHQAPAGARAADELDEFGFPRARGRKFVERVTQLVAEVADALDHAHRAGILHSDVKPSNVIVGRDGRARLLDFGLARVLDDQALSHTSDFVGTPNYIAPERLLSQQSVDHRSDVYSLGVTLYQALGARAPFDGETPAQVFQAILRAEALPLRRLAPFVSRDLETVCACAMDREPRRRYSSARDFADDLRRTLAGEPVRARPLGPLPRALRWARRRPAAAAALVLTSALAVGVPTAEHFASRAIEEQRRASDELARFLSTLIFESDIEERGEDARVVDVLEVAAERMLDQEPGAPVVIAELMRKLGANLSERERLEPARRLLERAEQIQLAHLGPSHEEVANTRNAFGNLLRRAGDSGGAEDTYRLALADWTGRAADGDALALNLTNNLAGLLVEGGHHDEARPLLEPLIDTLQAGRIAQGAERADLQLLLGRLLRRTGKALEAEPWLERALTDCIAVHGQSSRWTARCAQELGAVLLALGRPEEAERCFRDGLEWISQARHAPGWIVGYLERGLANALHAQCRYDDALEPFGRALQSLELDLGTKLGEVNLTYRARAAARAELGDLEGALADLANADAALEPTPASLRSRSINGLWRFIYLVRAAQAARADEAIARLEAAVSEGLAWGERGLRGDVEGAAQQLEREGFFVEAARLRACVPQDEAGERGKP